MSDNTRSYPRYAVAAKARIEAGGTTIEATSKNLSAGGLCAEAIDGLVLGTEAMLELVLVFDRDSVSEPLRLPGRVVWCTPLGEGHQIGFQFLALDAEQIENLNMFLRFLEEGRSDDHGPSEDTPFS